jgi:hypothetical protein
MRRAAECFRWPAGVFLALLATACATAPTVAPERRSEIAAAAQACLREHPTVEDYEVDRFGYVTAIYRIDCAADGLVDAPIADIATPCNPTSRPNHAGVRREGTPCARIHNPVSKTTISFR